jgi:hypothetical protein
MDLGRIQYNAAVRYTERNAYRLKIDNAKALFIVLLSAVVTIIYLAISLMLPKF